MEKQTGELKVALVGPYPPPYGGVSIHIQRLHGQSAADDIISTVFDNSRHVKKVRGVLNLSRFWNWPRILLSRQDIIHVHTTSTHWLIPAFFLFLARLKGIKFVLSYHSLRYDLRDFGLIGRRMIRVILRLASHCIATNHEIKERLISLGAKPENITVIPVFLPPVIKESEINEIPQIAWDFIDSHKPVISASAFRIVLFEGIDRYGIDMCIELCAGLKSACPEIGLIFCLPEIGDLDYFNELKRRIVEKGIEENFLFQTKPCQFYPVLMKSDLFVRPTNTDSYGISVAEAVYFKVPAIASDVCQRPAGTVLFKNRDTEDFISRVKIVWDNHDDYEVKADTVKVESGREEILEIYRRLTGKSGYSTP
jgi:glycosyltransferase involved in cell wall biosynthesis